MFKKPLKIIELNLEHTFVHPVKMYKLLQSLN